MRRMSWTLTCASALLLVACATPTPGGPTVRTFANPAAIAIPGGGATLGPADPYPSAIEVSGMPGTITKVTVTLSSLAHAFPRDLDVLVVGPTGLRAMLLSDVGGTDAVTGVTLVFDATSADVVPEQGPLVSGTFRPSALGDPDVLDPPAPGGPYGSDLTVFQGSNANGTWFLYVYDDFGGDVGALDGGWSLSLTTY